MNPIWKMMTGTLCSHLLGFLRDVTFFAVLGSSLETSAFLIAFLIPNLFRRLCGEGALTTAFIPVFAQKMKQQPQTAHAFLNCFFTRFGIALGGFCFLVGILLWIGQNLFLAEKTNLVLRLTLLMLPFLWFICTAALLNGTLNVLHAFLLTAFSSTFSNFSLLLGLWLCSCIHRSMTEKVTFLSLFVVLGGWFQWFLPKKQLQYHGFRPTFSWQTNAEVSRVWQLFLPSVIGAILFQLNNVLGEFLSYGIDAPRTGHLCLAGRFINLPFSLFSVSIFSVLFPQLSLALSQKNTASAKNLLHRSLRLTLLLLLPSTVGLYVLSQPLLSLCFQWGNFSFTDIGYTVPLMKWYALQLPFSGIVAILNRVFYSYQNVKTPVYNTAMTLLVHFLSCCFFIHFLGVVGIPIGTLASTVFQLALQLYELKKFYPTLQGMRKVFLHFPWIGFLIYAFLIKLLASSLLWSDSKGITALLLSGFILLAVAGYALMLWICDREGLHQVLRMQLSEKTSPSKPS